MYLGYNTALGIKVNKAIPGFLDKNLVTRSFGETNEPRDPNQPHNLWKPAPGDWAAHGPFDREAQNYSLQMELSKRRAALAGLGVAGVLAFLWLRRNGDRVRTTRSAARVRRGAKRPASSSEIRQASAPAGVT